MTAEAYLKIVEEKERLNQSLIPTIRISENYSSLVSLKDADIGVMFEPSIIEGYKYLIRQQLIRKVDRINQELEKLEKVLIVRSTWLSPKDHQLIWDKEFADLKNQFPNKSDAEIGELITEFVRPENESMHRTGGAIEALIYDQKTEQILDFGHNEGFNLKLNEQAYPYHPDISELAKKNRKLLIDVFQYEGFVVDIKKYWRFDYGNIIWAIDGKKKHADYGMVKK